METEYYWRLNRGDGSFYLVNYYRKGTDVKYIPAPSMAEGWRALKDELKTEKNIVAAIQEVDEYTATGADIAILCVEVCSDINKLCELLIWVKRRKDGR